MDPETPVTPADPGAFQTNDFGDRYLYAVNRDLFASLDARTRFNAEFGDDLFQPDTLYLVCGSDSGLLARHVLNRGIPRNSRYLFVELPELVGTLQREIAPFADDEQDALAILSFDDFTRRREAFDYETYLYLGRVRLVRAFCARDGHVPAYLPLWRRVKKDHDYNHWHASSRSTLRHHLARQIENLPSNRQSAGILQDRFRDCAALVVGGGPSLDDILPWIRAHQDRLLVIAVSRVCGILQRAGIRPHILVSIDPFPCELGVSEAMLELQADSLFVNGFHIYPPLAERWTGRRLFIGPRYPWGAAGQEDNLPQWGPTVSNAALGLAAELGCNPVVMAGIDLCYSQEGYTHARGTEERAAGPALMEGDQLVRTNAGLLAPTRNEFRQAADSMENLARAAADKGIRLLNPAPGAMAMEGVDFVPLDALELPRPDGDPGERLATLVPLPGAEDQRRYYETLDIELKRILRDMGALRRLVDKARKAARRFAGGDGRAKGTMDRIERDIDQRFDHLVGFLKTYGLRHFITTLRLARAEDWKAEEAVAYATQYYDAYHTTIGEVESLLRDLSRDLTFRFMELEPDHLPRRLLAYWEDRDRCWRAAAWRETHPEAARRLDEETRQRLQRLDARYDQLKAESRAVRKPYLESMKSLHGLQALAAEYFQNDDRTGLERLRSGLRVHPDRAKAEPLLALVEGLIAESRQDPLAAMRAYAAVDRGPAHEDALMRLVLLQLDRGAYQHARETLGRLTGLSDYYLPLSADLERIMGDPQQALEQYTRYLAKAPNDLLVMMKMGSVCEQLGITEGAVWAMQQVLARDPDNASARRLLERLQGTGTAG